MHPPAQQGHPALELERGWGLAPGARVGQMACGEAEACHCPPGFSSLLGRHLRFVRSRSWWPWAHPQPLANTREPAQYRVPAPPCLFHSDPVPSLGRHRVSSSQAHAGRWPSPLTAGPSQSWAGSHFLSGPLLRVSVMVPPACVGSTGSGWGQEGARPWKREILSWGSNEPGCVSTRTRRWGLDRKASSCLPPGPCNARS